MGYDVIIDTGLDNIANINYLRNQGYTYMYTADKLHILNVKIDNESDLFNLCNDLLITLKHSRLYNSFKSFIVNLIIGKLFKDLKDEKEVNYDIDNYFLGIYQSEKEK